MPRLPVDGNKVVEHRITFGTKEREQIDQLTNSLEVQNYSKAFENLATPMVNLMNDVTGMIVFLTILAALGVTGATFTFLYAASRADDVAAVMDAFLTQREQAVILAGGEVIFGAVPGGSFFWRWFARTFEFGYTSDEGGSTNGFQPETGPGSPGFQHPAYQDDQPTWSGTGIPDVGR